MQATVGLLVAKTLTNATANPFLSGGAGAYNPVVALDVFLVQVAPSYLNRSLDLCFRNKCVGQYLAFVIKSAFVYSLEVLLCTSV